MNWIEGLRTCMDTFEEWHYFIVGFSMGFIGGWVCCGLWVLKFI